MFSYLFVFVFVVVWSANCLLWMCWGRVRVVMSWVKQNWTCLDQILLSSTPHR